MKVLSIGNSFSTDAHRYLHQLAEINNIEMETVNLFIGGCDLETHWINLTENNALYDIESNGLISIPDGSITQILNSDIYDIITLQQASPLSGIYESTQPYLSNLAEYVKSIQPQAKIYYHQTWAYDTDSDHPGFCNYNNDQIKMYNCIKETARKAADAISAEIIPTGDVIQLLRTRQEFDSKNDGISLCRDGFHLSLDYGRFAAGATWLRTFTGKNVFCERFDGMNDNFIEIILETVNGIQHLNSHKFTQ